VVVYKVDRFSRSLLDFARMMQTFDKYKVSFVSVTQQFNTATSMGRLVLLPNPGTDVPGWPAPSSSGRSSRNGPWTRSPPRAARVSGPVGTRSSATTWTRAASGWSSTRPRPSACGPSSSSTSNTSLCCRSCRSWSGAAGSTSAGQTRKGRERGGHPFERTSLYRLLTNVAYVGKVRYKDEVHDGEHPGIVDPAVFQRVQSLLQRNGQTRGAPVRNKFGALLKGIIRCVPCDCAMTPLHTTRNGSKRYRYYVCCSAQKRGWDTCPSKSIPAAQIEEFVVGQIKCIGQDRALLEAVLAEARRQGVTLPPLRTLPGSCQMCTTNAATQTTLASCCTR
jgi:site-specific DNA recombinase